MVKSNIDALRSVYLSLGGSLDDTYEDINGGSPVSAYRSVKDHIAAISKLDIGSSGGGSSGGGGNGLFVVNITSVGETFTSAKFSKRYQKTKMLLPGTRRQIEKLSIH